MNIDLSPEETQNLITFINAYSAQGQAQEVAVMLKLKLNKAIQAEQLMNSRPVQADPSRDGAKEPAEIPAES